MKELDYSALGHPITRAEAKPFKARTWQNFWAAFGLIIFVMFFTGVVISFIFQFMSDAQWWKVIVAYTVPVITILVLVNEHSYRTARQRARLDAFARQNNMKFSYLVDNSKKNRNDFLART